MDVKITREIPLEEVNEAFCWFHPRAAAIPGAGRDGQPRVVMVLSRHMDADDHYSGLWYMTSDDLGRSWAGPFEPAALAASEDEPGIHSSFHDVTPGWHAAARTVLAIGTKTSYAADGSHANDKPGRIRTCYAVYDAAADAWSPIHDLALPKGGIFDLAASGACQWVEREDGTVLAPVYYPVPAGRPGKGYGVVVLECGFDGRTLSYRRCGNEIVRDEAAGFTESSLVRYRGRYYLTLRGEVDVNGYVGVSDDGLNFARIVPWTFDDGTPLGSVNTQQHWLAHPEGLFLCYTRSGADNDDIPRSRAPLFMARVDVERLCVIRATERVLIPNRGLMLGNFGAGPISPSESWVTDAEFLWLRAGYKPTDRGGNGSVWIARVGWPTPNAYAPA